MPRVVAYPECGIKGSEQRGNRSERCQQEHREYARLTYTLELVEKLQSRGIVQSGVIDWHLSGFIQKVRPHSLHDHPACGRVKASDKSASVLQFAYQSSCKLCPVWNGEFSQSGIFHFSGSFSQHALDLPVVVLNYWCEQSLQPRIVVNGNAHGGVTEISFGGIKSKKAVETFIDEHEIFLIAEPLPNATTRANRQWHRLPSKPSQIRISDEAHNKSISPGIPCVVAAPGGRYCFESKIEKGGRRAALNCQERS